MYFDMQHNESIYLLEYILGPRLYIVLSRPIGKKFFVLLYDTFIFLDVF